MNIKKIKLGRGLQDKSFHGESTFQFLPHQQQQQNDSTIASVDSINIDSKGNSFYLFIYLFIYVLLLLLLLMLLLLLLLLKIHIKFISHNIK